MPTGTPEAKSTRVRVQDAAWELIEAGQAPSRAKIRDRIGTGGSDATIADELIQFWPALGEFVLQSRTQPEIPAEFLAAYQQLITQAREIESRRWYEERQTLIQVADEAKKELLARTEEQNAMAERHRAMAEALNATETQLAASVEQCEALGQKQGEDQRRIADLEEQLAVAVKREDALRQDKQKELDQAYGRADETEKRLTGLYDKERTAREMVDQRLAEQLERVRELGTSASRLEAQNQALQKDVVRLEARVVELSGVEKSLSELDKLHGAIQAQLVESRERETALGEKLEALRHEVIDAKLEKAGLLSDLKGQLKTIAEQGRQIKVLESAAKKRAK